MLSGQDILATRPLDLRQKAFGNESVFSRNCSTLVERRRVTTSAHIVCLLTDPKPRERHFWLAKLAALLDPFEQPPQQVRRAQSSEGSTLEVRRRHSLKLWSLNDDYWLDPKGRLFQRAVQRLRTFRQQELLVQDECHHYRQVQAEARIIKEFRARLFPSLRRQAWQLWPKLGAEQRQNLVALGGDWQEVSAAISGLSADEQIESLILVLSPGASPHLTADFLRAAAAEKVAAPTPVLAWLLAQDVWSRNPGLVGLARAAVRRDLDSAFRLHRHPNPLVRWRLVDLLPPNSDWIGWLSEECNENVRMRLLQSLSRSRRPSQMVNLLLQEKDPRRREAIGWALINWPVLESPDDWRALNRALGAGLGRAQKRSLKSRLKNSGRLSLSARLLR